MPKNFLRKATKTTLVVCNAAIAFFMLVGCYGSFLNQKTFWFTGLFTLATLYFLLLLVGFLIFWLFVKPRLIFISLLTIAICWGPLRQAIRFRVRNDFSVTKNPAALRVMSWNVSHFDILEHKTHPEKKWEMVDLVSGIHPDVACFQEMVASDSAPKAINKLTDFLSKFEMDQYHYSYNPKLDFDSKHRFGIIIFSKYPIINKQTVGYSPYDYNSIFQYVDIVKEKDTFRVFNIHLQSLKFTQDNRKYIDDPSLEGEADIEKSRSVLAKFRIGFSKRVTQSNRIREEIEKSPYPVVVCGDFNDVPNSYAYRTIGKDLQNAFTEKGAGIGSTFDGISATLRIDNIFADEKFTVLQFGRIKKKLSDHFPIIADLSLVNKE